MLKYGFGSIKNSTNKNIGTILKSLFGLMVESKNYFGSMAEKRSSEFFKEALALPFVFAKEMVRLYLDKIAKDADGIINQLHECSSKIIQEAPLHSIRRGQ